MQRKACVEARLPSPGAGSLKHLGKRVCALITISKENMCQYMSLNNIDVKVARGVA
jgi:hypothetical protein